jgi:oligopeptide transport system ATP-binding protein
LYANPQHPYTEGLMASVPALDGTPGDRLQTIPGQPPDLANLPAGCAFAPRCVHAKAECRQATPSLEYVGVQHERACFGYER